MASSSLRRSLHKAFAEIVGKAAVLTEPADCLPYGYDNSRLQALPMAVLFASEHRQVEAIVGLCNEQGLRLIPRGTGTGTTGATVPTEGEIVLSLQRMQRILQIQPENRLARVEPGVTNQALQEALAKRGFFWPPDPTSASICTIGGNLAYNSAGPRAVKYGTPRENTLGLQAVIGSGATIRTGVNTTKGVVGYDLTRLLIGSEGTLGVITEATLKLTPLPQTKRTLAASYRDIHAAARAVSAIMAQPVTPCVLEFMDGAALGTVRDYTDPALDASIGALLLIEVDGTQAGIRQDVQAVAEAASVDGTIEVRIARSEEEVENLWQTRKALSPALRNAAPKKINEDVVVPVARIPDLIDGLQRLSRETGIRIINFGHAGNGNIHVNLLLDPDDPAQSTAAETCLSRLFDLVLELGGTLSGEHGIGLVKKAFVAREIDPITLELMRRIRRQFDPNQVLSPGKLFPDTD